MAEFHKRPEQDPTVQFQQTTAPAASRSAVELIRMLDKYLEDLRAGKQPDRDGLLAQRPDLALLWSECVSGIEFIHRSSETGSPTPKRLGDFQIIREVGRGGMGVVYEAQQLSLKRRVALKVLRFGAVGDPIAMQRFQREAETVAGLHHTNIVPIFAIGCEQDVHYYAMQFIEGRSLAEWAKSVKEEDQLTVMKIAGWGVQAAEALAHAHQRGVIHRDIKPSNLLLDDSGQIWLSDFGLARRSEDVTLSIAGLLLGTPRYMSPEQAQALHQVLDHRSDIYSLGATLYELSTGRPIFDGDSPDKIIAQILTCQPRAPRSVRPTFPRDLETILLKCLAKEPERRYPAADALAADLRAVVEGRTISARRPTLIERTTRWTKQHRRAIILVITSGTATLSVLVTVFLGLFWIRESRLGTFTLDTTDPNMVAELIQTSSDAADTSAIERVVVPSFRIPTVSPISVPVGTYQLRMSAPGLLSETLTLDVLSRTASKFAVTMRPELLWTRTDSSPVETPKDEVPSTSMLNPAIHIDTTENSLNVTAVNTSSTSVRVSRLNGATGETVWPSDFVFTNENYCDLFKSIDLNRDGTNDLLFFCRAKQSQDHYCVAISGQDGTLLWKSVHLQPTDPTHWVPARHPRYGVALLDDLDNDGTADMVHYSVQPVVNPQSRRIELESDLNIISGMTGSIISAEHTAVDVGPALDKYLRTLFSEHTYVAEHVLKGTYAIPVVWRNKHVLAIIVFNTLVGVDIRSGQEAWTPRQLGFSPNTSPFAVDLDIDGDKDLLFWDSVAKWEDKQFSVTATAIALPSTPNKETTTTPGEDRQSNGDSVSQPMMPLWSFTSKVKVETVASDLSQNVDLAHLIAEDLDADQRLELVLIFVDETVAVIDAATGRRRWMTSGKVVDRQPRISLSDSIITGADLDADGVRDVFVFTEKGGVVALSGHDGSQLWRHNTYGMKPSGTLTWWQPNLDVDRGYFPQLVVPLQRADGPVLFILDGCTGHLIRTVMPGSNQHVADFNDDGLSDLLYVSETQGVRQMRVAKGNASVAWTRKGEWSVMHDHDADRYYDLIGWSTIRDGDWNSLVNTDRPFSVGTMLSGQSGRWLQDLKLERTGQSVALSRLIRDLDGDDVPDFIAIASRAIAAHSGKDGQQLWEKASRSREDGVACVLHSDGQLEMFYSSYYGLYKDANTLSVVSNRGKRLWGHKFDNCKMFSYEPNPYDRPFGDVNGDGVQDVVVWTSPRGLIAHSGVDGTSLWPPKLAMDPEGITTLLGPHPVVGDLNGDGVSEVIAVLKKEDLPGQLNSKLVVADGPTGTIRWTKPLQATEVSYRKWITLPPLLVDFHGNHRPYICVTSNESIVAYDSDGQIRGQINSISVTESFFNWRKYDLNDDGREEILFINGEHALCATKWDVDDSVLSSKSAAASMWQWPLPGEAWAQIVGIQSSGPQSGRTTHYKRTNNDDASIKTVDRRGVTVVVWVGNSVYGLAGDTGVALWRCDVPPSPGAPNDLIRSEFQGDPPLAVLTAGDSSRFPCIVFHDAQRDLTIVYQSLPVTPDRRYALPIKR